MEPHRQLYGRHLEDFEIGHTYAHPWEITVGSGDASLFAATFVDTMPTFESRPFAEGLGFRERPLPPMFLLNLALSLSGHDITEQARGVSYRSVRFPRAVYPDDTLRARSTCIDVSRNADGSSGVVQVRTGLYNQSRQIVCWIERDVVVPGGSLSLRPYEHHALHRPVPQTAQPLPPELATLPPAIARDFGFPGHFEDFVRGQIYVHQWHRKILDGETQMLSTLLRDTRALNHPGTGEPSVPGGLVFAWAASLSSRDLCGRAVWELGYEDGVHLTPVHPGDTLTAASKVIALDSVAQDYGAVHVRVVLVKNAPPEAMLEHSHALFHAAGTCAKGAPQKVFGVTRHILVRRRP